MDWNKNNQTKNNKLKIDENIIIKVFEDWTTKKRHQVLREMNKNRNKNALSDMLFQFQKQQQGSQYLGGNELQILDLSAIQQQKSVESQHEAKKVSKIKNSNKFQNDQSDGDDSIDIRDIQFPQFFRQPDLNRIDEKGQQRQFENDQNDDLDNDEPLKGSFLKEMQELGKTLSFESRMYNIYHSSFLQSSAEKSRKSKNEGTGVGLLEANLINAKNICNEENSSQKGQTQFQALRKKISQMISIQLSDNFKMVQSKYVIDFEKSLGQRKPGQKQRQKMHLKETGRNEQFPSMEKSQTISRQSKPSKPSKKSKHSRLSKNSQPLTEPFERKVSSKSTFLSKTSISKNRTIPSHVDLQLVSNNKPMKKQSIKKIPIPVNKTATLRNQSKKAEADKKAGLYCINGNQKSAFTKNLIRKTEKTEKKDSNINSKFRSLISFCSQGKQQKCDKMLNTNSIDRLNFEQQELNSKTEKSMNLHDENSSKMVLKAKRKSVSKIKNK